MRQTRHKRINMKAPEVFFCKKIPFWNDKKNSLYDCDEANDYEKINDFRTFHFKVYKKRNILIIV